MKKHLITALISLAALSPQLGHAKDADAIVISNPYIKEVPPNTPATAAFMTLSNSSEHDIYLTAVQTQAAEKAELHTHTHENGVMRMRQIESIKVPAHGQVELKPGGLHIMLIHPTLTLKSGDQVTETLTFKDGSQHTHTLPVQSFMKNEQKPAKMPNPHEGHDMHSMHH